MIKFIKKYINKKKIFIQNHFSNFLYKANYLYLKKKNSELPNLGKENYEILQIDISKQEEEKILKDLEKFQNYIYVKHSFKYLVYEYPKEYLKQVKYAWGFDRKFYSKFIKEKLDKKIRDIYSFNNYRIEHIWLYENPPFSANVNEKFHIDGDMMGALKCLIYLTDVDTESGPFQVFDEKNNSYKEIIGKKGTTVFFNQNKLFHSNKKNGSKKRIVLSFTLYPSLRKKINYLYNKPLNAKFTLNPFTNQS